jgi:Family of unknown function (DUF5681)
MHRPVSGAAANPDDGTSGMSTDMQNKKPPEYEVGYRQPPKHTRFQRGSSGNPKGRPRASKNLSAVLETALNERVSVNDNGKRKKITMSEAIVKQAVRKAAGGDQRALRLVFDMWFRLHPEGKQEPSALELMRSLADEALQHIKTKAQASFDKAD